MGTPRSTKGDKFSSNRVASRFASSINPEDRKVRPQQRLRRVSFTRGTITCRPAASSTASPSRQDLRLKVSVEAVCEQNHFWACCFLHEVSSGRNGCESQCGSSRLLVRPRSFSESWESPGITSRRFASPPNFVTKGA